MNILLQVAILWTAGFQFFGYDSPNYLFKMPLLCEPLVVGVLQWGLAADDPKFRGHSLAVLVTKCYGAYFLACWLAVFLWMLYSGS